uniref:Nucleoporin NUP35 n=1 Tax=Panagrellus redivivus TaxID=6233 RepID=A0A7E4VAC9_PANRE
MSFGGSSTATVLPFRQNQLVSGSSINSTSSFGASGTDAKPNNHFFGSDRDKMMHAPHPLDLASRNSGYQPAAGNRTSYCTLFHPVLRVSDLVFVAMTVTTAVRSSGSIKVLLFLFSYALTQLKFVSF